MKSRTYRPGSTGIEQALGSREAAIMEYLWKHGAQAPGDLHRALSAKEPLAYSTVYTELSRLAKKGIVRKKGRHLEATYAAAVSREQFVTSLVSQVIGGLIDAHGAAAIHGFVDVIADDEESIDVVKRLLRSNRSKR
jgi:predicted transcriptional regulator